MTKDMTLDAQPGSSSILATARSATGAPVDHSRITESTVVKFGGMEKELPALDAAIRADQKNALDVKKFGPSALIR